MSPSRSPPNPATPWYREPYVWLLISIPAAAVLAGLITLSLAIASEDAAPDGAPVLGATSSHETGWVLSQRILDNAPIQRAALWRRVSSDGRPLAFFTHGLTPEGRPTHLPDTVWRTAGTGADFDLLPVDEAPAPTYDAGAARIIVGADLINVRTDAYVVGTHRIEASTRGNNV